MPYEKITFENGKAPGISSERLNHMQTQYEEAVAYADSKDHNHTNKSILDLITAAFTTALKNKLDGIEAGATGDLTASEILNLIKTVDGAGSGLDTDKFQGKVPSEFLLGTPIGSGTVSGYGDKVITHNLGRYAIFTASLSNNGDFIKAQDINSFTIYLSASNATSTYSYW